MTMELAGQIFVCASIVLSVGSMFIVPSRVYYLKRNGLSWTRHDPFRKLTEGVVLLAVIFLGISILLLSDIAA